MLSLFTDLWFYGMVVAMPGIIVFRTRWCGVPLATLFGWFAWLVWAYMSFRVDEHFYLLGELGDRNIPQIDEQVHPFVYMGLLFSGVYSFALLMVLVLIRVLRRKLTNLF